MNRLKVLLAIVAMFFFVGANAYKKESVDVVVNGKSRNIVVYTPNAMSSGLPLMIVTHGMNQNPEYQSDGDLFRDIIDAEKFVVAYLRSDGNMWDTGGENDQNFVLKAIEEMSTRHAINTNRVYWSGFSMGTMLIYHSLAKFADKIAAFAPTSGIQFSEQPWNALTKQINLLHCQSLSDDVFPYPQYDFISYVTNIAQKNGFTTYAKLENYSNESAVGTKEVWTDTSTGHVVALFRYTEGGHWPTVRNRKEIWDFCKQFSLRTPYEEYMDAYTKAKGLVDDWRLTPEMTAKASYTTLNKYLIDKSPENIDKDNADVLKTVTTKILSLISIFEKQTAGLTMRLDGGAMDQPTEFDPNFHIYLCFGQSNMEGNAAIESQDRSYVDPRFRMMAAVNMDNLQRKKDNWYVAYPPLCRGYNGLTPADYFGRTMVENLPDSIKVGVINVAVGGASIKVFDEDICASEIAGAADWFKNYCREYNNNPFRRLVECAKKAQKVGVIKGILLHQGCTDNGQKDWPVRVKRIYTRLLNELGLEESETPLLVGELLQQSEGGICWGHNSVIANIGNSVPNSYIISSAKCPAASDGLHFTAEGYRMIGKRYAEAMLKALGQTKQIDFDTTSGYFPLSVDAFNPSLCLDGTFKIVTKFGQYTGGGDNCFGGWRYSKGIDVSQFKYLIVELPRSSTATNFQLRIYDTDDCMNPYFSAKFGTDKKIVVDLQNMTDDKGNKIDPSHIFLVGFSMNGSTPVYINKVYLSDDGSTETSIDDTSLMLDDAEKVYYDLSGRMVKNPTSGVYIVNGKKTFIK